MPIFYPAVAENSHKISSLISTENEKKKKKKKKKKMLSAAVVISTLMVNHP